MGLFTGLFIGKEAMTTQGNALTTVADNIANTNTTGFKASRPEFSDLLADSIGSLYGSPISTGNGSKVNAVDVVQTQGPIENTGRGLDFSITGEGFFVLNKTSGSSTTTNYSRAGNFSTNPAGELIAQDGSQVMGFTGASPTTLVPLQISNISSTPTATSTAAVIGNLNGTSPELGTPPTQFTTFSELTKATTFTAPLTLVDSIGQKHEIGIHFFHDKGGVWSASAFVDSGELGQTAGTPVSIGTAALTFQSDGTQGTGAATSLTISASWGNGAAASSTAIDLSKFTGYAIPSAVSSVTSNGVIPGQVVGLDLAADGKLSAQLDNGTFVSIGTVALAKFINPSGLQRVGDNNFEETTESGAADTGGPQGEGTGSYQGGIARELNGRPG